MVLSCMIGGSGFGVGVDGDDDPDKSMTTLASDHITLPPLASRLSNALITSTI